MVAVKTFVSVWHPHLSASEIVEKTRFEPIITANKGDARGKLDAKFPETYCYFQVGEIQVEREAEIVGHVISALGPLDDLSSIIASGGRIWVTAKIPSNVYEVSISSEEMQKLGTHKVGLSFDVSSVTD